MNTENKSKLVIAISSTALFDMAESHNIYEQQGVVAYADYQRQHEDEILSPGEAFPLAQNYCGSTINSRVTQEWKLFCCHEIRQILG